jgi:hypothetical protein
MHRNPFYYKALPEDAPFCDRTDELKYLVKYAKSKNDLVLYAPRRFGKTSLVRRVQKELAKQGVVAIYVNFFGIGSVNEVAARLAAAVFKITHGKESLWKKAIRFIFSFRPVLRPTLDGYVEITAEPASRDTGMLLLEKVLNELEQFIVDCDHLVQISFDEFQEIVTLPEAEQIEAAMRTRIESYQASHFFIGSRRRVLLGIFSETQRPFFQSAHIFPLGPLPKDELAEFISSRFAEGGVSCHVSVGLEIARLVECHPYYSQRIAFIAAEEAKDNEVDLDSVHSAFRSLVKDVEPVFEAMLQGLPPQQRLVLRALAREPVRRVTSKDYILRHDLGSVTGINYSLSQLERLDFIDQERNSKVWSVVDPVFAVWLTD